MGRGETIKIYLKKADQGQGWTHVPPKDSGHDVGERYETPRRHDDAGAKQSGHSPLTTEILAPEENISDLLDYEDDVQQEDPEIVQAVTNIPQNTGEPDVEMEEDNRTSGFKPEVGRSS